MKKKEIDVQLALNALSTLGKYRLENGDPRKGELPNAIEMMAASEEGKINAAPVRFNRIALRGTGQFYLEHYGPFSLVNGETDRLNDLWQTTMAVAHANSPQGDHYAALRERIKEIVEMEKASKLYELGRFGSKDGICAFANEKRCILMTEQTFHSIHDGIEESVASLRNECAKKIIAAQNIETGLRTLAGIVSHPLS